MLRNNILNGVALWSLLLFFSLLMIPACDWSTDLTVQEWLDILNGDPEPVQVDTCTQADLHQVHDPLFISVWAAFDCVSDSLRWHIGTQHGGTDDVADMIMAMNPAVDTVEVYESEDEIAVIIDGVSDKAWLQGRISINPSCNPVDILPQIGRMSLYFGNALTFDQWMGVLDRHPSNSAMSQRNNLTQEEKNLIWENNLDYDSCKIAPTNTPLPNRIDFRHDNAPQSIRERYKERGWNCVE